MATRDLVVIGGSAGGVQAVSQLLAALPVGLRASVVVVLHTPAAGKGTTARVLGRVSGLPVDRATDGDQLRMGHVYVARPDHHVVVREGRLLLPRSPRVNRVRPAVDPLFRSAARWYGPRAVGIVVSGVLDDGAAGGAVLASRGGVVLVQEPLEAAFAGMPRAVLAAVPEAKALTIAEMASVLSEIIGAPVEERDEPDADLIAETDRAEREESSVNGLIGTPVPVECPECGGGMSRIDAGGVPHYECEVGHPSSPRTRLPDRAAVSILQEQARGPGREPSQAR